VLAGPINATSFAAWVAQSLIRALNPGDIVIADNLGSHKGKSVCNAIRSVGATLFFLPPDSPYLNPIEMMFAKLKTCCERRMCDLSTRPGGELLDCLGPDECFAYFRHASYASFLSVFLKSRTPAQGISGGVEKSLSD
jgi:hypothetical protein